MLRGSRFADQMSESRCGIPEFLPGLSLFHYVPAGEQQKMPDRAHHEGTI